MMRTSEVVVVGGGVIGTSVAFHLAREGIEVTLLERDALAAGASGAAAGMLAPRSEAVAEGAFRALAERSHERFAPLAKELLDRSGVDCEWERCGTLVLAHEEGEAASLEARAAGEGVGEWLDASALRASEAAVSPEALGALFCPDEAHVRSPLLVRAYATAARRFGARIETGCEVTGVRVEGGRITGVDSADGAWSTPRVVFCAGAWSGLAGVWPEGSTLPPVEPVRGQILSLDPPTPKLGHMLRGAGGYAVPKRDGSVVLGATEERVGFDARVTAEGVNQLLAIGRALLPGLGDATFRTAWAGLRPGTPDGFPLLGPVPGVEGLALAAGHHRNGVLLSPVTGEIIVDWISGQATAEDAKAFLPDRFLGGAVAD